MIAFLSVLIGFVLLIKGADILVDGAVSIARKFNISDLVVALTIVAFGTSSPELFVNVVASLQGNADIAIGNILGSTIANVFLVLGVCALIFPLAVAKSTAWKEIPFSLFASILFTFLGFDLFISNSEISFLSRIDSVVFLFFFVVFLWYSFLISKKNAGLTEPLLAKQHGVLKSLVLVMAGLLGLSWGGNLIVNGSVSIARFLGVSDSLIGFTVVAVGTCLPELATSAVAAYKRNVEIAVGSIVGSNIFNMFFVLGISAFIKPLEISGSFGIDALVMVLANLMLFLAMFSGKRRCLDRWEGLVFLIFYLCYLSFLIVRG